MTTPVFANLSGLVETNEESIIVPCLEGVHCVAQWWGVDLGHHLGWGSIQLGKVDRVPIIPFVGVSRGYTDHHQGRGHSIRPTATLINIHEHLI